MLDELHGNVQYHEHFCLMCLTETWLHNNITNASVNVEGYKPFTPDGQKESGKKKGEEFLFT